MNMKSTSNKYRCAYRSILGPYLYQFIEFEQAKGRTFTREKTYLGYLDGYCLAQGLEHPRFTEDFINTWCAALSVYTKYMREQLLRLTRKFSSYLAIFQEDSFVLPVPVKKEYKPQSILAPYINEFIAAKRAQGLKYLSEGMALKSFDKYCCNQDLQYVYDATEPFVREWHRRRSKAPNHKDYTYAVRDLLIFMKAFKNLPVHIPRKRYQEAHPCLVYEFSSAFASLINDFIEQKTACGFKYDSERKILRYFDLLCIELKVKQPVLTREIVQCWSMQRPTEGESYRVKRVSIIRQFALFLISRGHVAYRAPICPAAAHARPHIFRDEELVAFFACCEEYQAANALVSVALPVIFRFYYCLGLRLNEAIELTCKDINLEDGRVHICLAKYLKDRIVYLPEDLLAVAVKYHQEIERQIPNRRYFFVSDLLGTKFRGTSLCKYFNNIWRMTGHDELVDKKPTIHCFRHTLVVRKLEEWYRKKEDCTYWLPYLCAFLGHTSLKDTYHYIHMVDSSFPLIRDTMQLFEHLYPQEVSI